MKIEEIVVLTILLQTSSGQVNLHLVNEQTCFGDDVTFYCNATEAELIGWSIANLPGVTGATTNQFGTNLATTFERITSPDTSSGPNPSIITILNVTAADNGATVQCGILNGGSSEVISLFIRPLECSVSVNVTGVTSTSITVRLMWTNCAGAEPSSISLMWSPLDDSGSTASRDINTQTEITNLNSNTNYNITATFSDACGSVSDVVVAATLPQLVNLHLVNEPTCSGDDLTFYCNTTEAGLLVWNIANLSGVTGTTTNQFGTNLATTFERITSPDTSFGPNPSVITILNVTAADNGATVQCRIVNGALSEVVTLSIRLPACSVTVNVTAVTSTSITVRLVWINCAGAEPSSILLMWSSLDDFGSTASRDINTQTEITGLKPNTNYNITATFSDACGSISDVVVAATLTQLVDPSATASSPSPSSMPPGSADLGVVIGTVAGVLIALALVVTIVIVAAIVVKVFF